MDGWERCINRWKMDWWMDELTGKVGGWMGNVFGWVDRFMDKLVNGWVDDCMNIGELYLFFSIFQVRKRLF